MCAYAGLVCAGWARLCARFILADSFCQAKEGKVKKNKSFTGRAVLERGDPKKSDLQSNARTRTRTTQGNKKLKRIECTQHTMGDNGVLILGANSAVAQVYMELLARYSVPCTPVTRKDCDLLDPAAIDAYVGRNQGRQFRYAVHFATTYTDADVPMARNIARLVDGLQIPRLVFMSSWVVLLEDAPISGTKYIAAKRECEKLLREHWASQPERLRIVRISVAIGDQRLLHDKLLRRLAPLAFMLPSNMRRCFIDVHELCAATRAIAASEGGLQTHCVLGPLRTVAEIATELVETQPGPRGGHGFFLAVLGAIKTVVTTPVGFILRHTVGRILRFAVYALLFWASKLCTYFKGWCVDEFAPSSQTDLLSLVSPHNLPYVQFVGGGAVRNAWGCIEPHRTVVSTRNFNGILAVGAKSVVCKSGTVFKELLDYLAARDLAPTVVPNYSYISIGAAALGPVHGSSLELPLCAQSIGQVQWYNTHTGEVQYVYVPRLQFYFGAWVTALPCRVNCCAAFELIVGMGQLQKLTTSNGAFPVTSSLRLSWSCRYSICNCEKTETGRLLSPLTFSLVVGVDTVAAG